MQATFYRGRAETPLRLVHQSILRQMQSNSRTIRTRDTGTLAILCFVRKESHGTQYNAQWNDYTTAEAPETDVFPSTDNPAQHHISRSEKAHER